MSLTNRMIDREIMGLMSDGKPHTPREIYKKSDFSLSTCLFSMERLHRRGLAERGEMPKNDGRYDTKYSLKTEE